MQSTELQTTPKQMPTYTRSFRIAAWLGWQIESNWTDPFLFAIYSIIKPLAGAAILVVMYSVITSADFSDPIFTYIYLGNAFYIYVGSVMTGISWAVIDDREHYKTLKFMYIAPINIPAYLIGRGVAKFLVGFDLGLYHHHLRRALPAREYRPRCHQLATFRGIPCYWHCHACHDGTDPRRDQLDDCEPCLVHRRCCCRGAFPVQRCHLSAGSPARLDPLDWLLESGHLLAGNTAPFIGR